MEEKFKDIRLILTRDEVSKMAEKAYITFPSGLKLDITFPTNALVGHTLEILREFLMQGIRIEPEPKTEWWWQRRNNRKESEILD